VALVAGIDVVIDGEGLFEAGLFKGAPTAISHRWPGLPCSGFKTRPDVLFKAGRLELVVVAFWIVVAGETVFVVDGVTGCSLVSDLLLQETKKVKRIRMGVYNKFFMYAFLNCYQIFIIYHKISFFTWEF
jgi:hypothetical protein